MRAAANIRIWFPTEECGAEEIRTVFCGDKIFQCCCVLGSEDHSANLSQFLLAQRCVPPDCGVGDYPHVFLNQVIRDPCLGESCD